MEAIQILRAGLIAIPTYFVTNFGKDCAQQFEVWFKVAKECYKDKLFRGQ